MAVQPHTLPPLETAAPGASLPQILVAAYKEWSAVEAPRLGASLAYYTTLSLAPLLLVLVGIAGIALDQQSVRQALLNQIQSLVGQEGAATVASMLQRNDAAKSGVASVIGLLALLFGATSVVAELRTTMNKIWKVQERDDFADIIKQRSYALGLVLGAGFLLLVSLVVSATVAALGAWFGNLMPLPEWLSQVVSFLISLVPTVLIFMLMFRFLPSVQLSWRDVATGGLLTAVLFTIGKTLIGIYLGKAGVGSAYGAAGSLVILLVWIYYSAQIFFFGAELTRVYALTRGSHRHDFEKARAARA